jgi:hypothetical protein
MMPDIVERLRGYQTVDHRGDHDLDPHPAICDEAASEIERLRAKITKADYLLTQGAPSLALEALQG